MRFKCFARGFLLGTSALMTVALPAAADFDISGTDSTPQTLSADQTGIVRAGGVLNVFAAPEAVRIDGTNTTLENQGQITGSISGIGVVAGADVSGGLTNGGMISGISAGISVLSGGDISGGVDNSGTIVNGILLNSGSISGGVNNSNTINGSSFFAAIDLSDSVISNGIVNTNRIESQDSGISISSNSVVSGMVDGSGAVVSPAIENFGTILGDTDGIAITTQSLAQGEITNSGTISGTNRFGIQIGAGSRLDGGIRNGNTSGQGTITGVVGGVVVDFNSFISGGIENSGTILGQGFAGVAVNNGSDISNGIVNSGLISGDVGVFVSADSLLSGGVVNSGTITGTGGVAIQFGDGDESLVLQTGSVLNGDVDGGVGSDSLTLEGSGNEDSSFTGFESLAANGVDWTFGRGIDLGATGTADVNSGLLTVTGDLNALTTTVASNAILDAGGVLNSNVDLSGTLRNGTVGSTVQFGSGDESLTLRSGSVLNGDVDGGMGSDSLILDGGGLEDSAFTNFETLAVNAAGNWDLSGSVSLVGVATASVNSGLLSINGTLDAPGGVTVASGAALGGSGRITGNVVNRGSIAPGNSPGVLTVNGDVAFDAGSSFDVEVAGTVADQLIVTGSVTVDPTATLNVVSVGPAVDLQNVPVLTVGSGPTPTFTIVNSSSLAVTQSVTTNTLNVNGTVTGGTGGSTGGTGGSTGGTGGSTGGTGGGLTITVNAVSATGPNTLVRAGTGDGFAFQQAVSSEALGAPVQRDHRIWGQGLAGFVDRDAEGALSGYSQTRAGAVLGADGLVAEDWRLGFAVGYTNSDVDYLQTTGDADIDSLHGGLYGVWQAEVATVSFGVQGAYQEYDLERSAISGTTTGQAEGDTEGYLVGGFIGLSRDIPVGDRWSLQPVGSVSYLHQEVDSFTDDSGLGTETLSTDSLRLRPTVSMVGEIPGSDGLVWRPHVSAGLEQNYALDSRDVDYNFANGTSASAALDDDNGTAVTFGAGLDIGFSNGVEAYITYDGAYGSEQSRSSLFSGVRVSF